MELSGKTVLLTGASGGIGAALALELCAEGAHVIAVARRGAALEQLRQRCAGRPGRLIPLPADITVAADRARIVAAAGAAALLIHAAALPGFGLIEHGDTSQDEALFVTNVLAPIALTRALLPTLLAQPQAAVVAVGSTFGSLAHPGFASYSASKFALRGFIEALGREYADTPLRAQWIAPRATDTGFNSAGAQALNRELKTRVDTPQQAAHAIVRAIAQGRRRTQLGWPERLFAWLNGAFPALIDRGLRASLPAVRRHAGGAAAPANAGQAPSARAASTAASTPAATAAPGVSP